MLRSILVILVLLFCLSCTEHLAYTSFRTMDSGNWGKNKAVEFTFSNLDTTMVYNMFITLRNDDQYPFSNLFLIAELNRPDGTSERDTLEYQMAEATGKWLGSGYGSVKENKFWYRENIVFTESGVYNVTLSHAMRKNGSVEGIEELPGVLDVGLQIEKNE